MGTGRIVVITILVVLILVILLSFFIGETIVIWIRNIQKWLGGGLLPIVPINHKGSTQYVRHQGYTDGCIPSCNVGTGSLVKNESLCQAACSANPKCAEYMYTDKPFGNYNCWMKNPPPGTFMLPFSGSTVGVKSS